MIPFENMHVEDGVRYAKFSGGLTFEASLRVETVAWPQIESEIAKARHRKDIVVLCPGGVLRVNGAATIDLPGEPDTGPVWFVPIPAIKKN